MCHASGWRRSSSEIPRLRTGSTVWGSPPRSPPRRRSPPPCGTRRAPASRGCRFARSTWSPTRTGLDGHRLQPARSGCCRRAARVLLPVDRVGDEPCRRRSEEHTSELQSLAYLVCRLLLEKKKKKKEK